MRIVRSAQCTGAIKELAVLQDGAFLTRLQECLGSQNYVVFLEFMSEVLRYLRINHRIYLAKDDQLSHVYATQKLATALAFGCRDFQTRAWRSVPFKLQSRIC